uniref:Putative holin n=1 Tax=viral metagenome TaxID=1070528 RepID=A0A6M3M2G4_9ZZZZ
MSFLTWLKILFGAIGTFLAPFIKMFLNDIGKVVLNIAMEVVLALAASAMPGAKKQKEAFKLIFDKLKAQGITVATHVINAAIEAAVAKLKEKEG